MSELKHKVGDKVRIKSLDWYNKKKDHHGNVCDEASLVFMSDMSKYCGETAVIWGITDHGDYRLSIDNKMWLWTDYMFEDNPEEELDLTKILKDCPKGTKLYSVVIGEVTFEKIYEERIRDIQSRSSQRFTYIGANEKNIRVKAAIAAMQSLLLNPTFSDKEVAERAIKQADALIEELKKKQNDKQD